MCSLSPNKLKIDLPFDLYDRILRKTRFLDALHQKIETLPEGSPKKRFFQTIFKIQSASLEKLKKEDRSPTVLLQKSPVGKWSLSTPTSLSLWVKTFSPDSA